MAVRILRFLAKEPWVQEIVESAYLEEELEEWVQQDTLG